MSKVVLPRSIQEFVQTESGSHLLLLLLENAVGNTLGRIKPSERDNVSKEYDLDAPLEMELKLLLDHLSEVRVVSNLNSHAEESLIDYWASPSDGKVFLIDAKNYVMDALRLAPEGHPEEARAYKNFAYIRLAKQKTQSACELINKALAIYQQHGQMEQIEELLEMLSTRTEAECKLTYENVAAVLRKMEIDHEA